MITVHSDDALVGRVLSRREAVGLLGLAGAALLTRTAFAQSRPAPACVVRPEQTEGPFFVDERLERGDIRSDPATGERRPGAPLELAFQVSRMAASGCAPLAGAVVDVWHCDARGAYSDVGGSGATQRFLRGYQSTDARGLARFTTIYPGWYEGRAVHVHFKIRTAQGQQFTSQIYFDEAASDRVFAREHAPEYAAPRPTTGAPSPRGRGYGSAQEGRAGCRAWRGIR
jgi:protocatechuate 3,4-dioxygenase beta subunit